MSSFKDMIREDNFNVFLNPDEFADRHIVYYDGHACAGDDGEGIPILLTKVKEKDRVQYMSDHAQGLYRVTAVLHCAQSDLGGAMPEQGQKLQINDDGYMREFYVASSTSDEGMLRVELEGFDE